MQITDTAAMEWGRLRPSSRNMLTSRKLLREGEALPGMGLYAVLVKLHEGEERFTAPRHRHNFSQIRLVLRGHMDFGPGLECGPGDVGFFPGGAHYGPEAIDGGDYVLLQWGRDWVTRAQDKEAISDLSQRGRFEHGMYFFDEDGAERSIDGKRAVWEYVYGREEVIRPARYRTPIIMSPAHFDWIEGDELSRKTLGRFTEDDVVIEMVRWDSAGAVHQLTAERTSLLFVRQGKVALGDHSCPAETVIWSDVGETNDITAEVGTEVIVFGFPLERG